MKTLLMRLGMAALLGVAAGAIASAPALADAVKITVLGVGDVYAFDGGKVRGGFARLNALAKKERADNPNTLYLHDGDMISPSLLSGLDFGANTIVLTNLVPFDLAVPGNHEFDFGPEVFMQRLGEANYPWAAVNIAGPDGKPVPGLGAEPVMKEFGGVKVAIVPIADDETPRTGDHQGLAVRAVGRHRRSMPRKRRARRAPTSSSRLPTPTTPPTTRCRTATNSTSSSPATTTTCAPAMTASPPMSKPRPRPISCPSSTRWSPSPRPRATRSAASAGRRISASSTPRASSPMRRRCSSSPTSRPSFRRNSTSRSAPRSVSSTAAARRGARRGKRHGRPHRRRDAGGGRGPTWR